MATKSEYITHEGQTFHAPTVAAMSWDAFKKEATEQREANKKGAPVHFSNWGDQADTKLKEAYEMALEHQGKSKPAAPATGNKKPNEQ